MWKVALSKWVNHHIFGGSPREMLSSRCMREKRVTAVSWLDWLAFWHDDHCWRCYQYQLREGDYGMEKQLEFDFLPHVTCANPKCNQMVPQRVVFVDRNGKPFCTHACATAKHLDDFIDDGVVQ